jgi:hypothetical protein
MGIEQALEAAVLSGGIAQTKRHLDTQEELPKRMRLCDGHDIVKKNSRQRSFLVVMPCRFKLKKESTSKQIGKICGLDSPTPVMYLDVGEKVASFF